MATDLWTSLARHVNRGLRSLRRRTRTASAIDGAYVRRQIGGFLRLAERTAPSMRGESVLIIGPGHDFHTGLILAGHGAEVTVVEKYPEDWIPSFHPVFYREVLENVAEDWPEIDPAPIEHVLREHSHHDVPGMRLVCRGLEEIDEIDEIDDESMAWTYSNAVFEHLADASAAIAQLYRVTRPGGVGLHQIDMRWHFDFDRPLEYCTMSDAEFANTLQETGGNCGNRHRYHEFQAFFEAAGFEIRNFLPSQFAEDGYLEDLITRAQPRYREMDREVLRVLGGHFTVVRPRPL